MIDSEVNNLINLSVMKNTTDAQWEGWDQWGAPRKSSLMTSKYGSSTLHFIYSLAPSPWEITWNQKMITRISNFSSHVETNAVVENEEDTINKWIKIIKQLLTFDYVERWCGRTKQPGRGTVGRWQIVSNKSISVSSHTPCSKSACTCAVWRRDWASRRSRRTRRARTNRWSGRSHSWDIHDNPV